MATDEKGDWVPDGMLYVASPPEMYDDTNVVRMNKRWFHRVHGYMLWLEGRIDLMPLEPIDRNELQELLKAWKGR